MMPQFNSSIEQLRRVARDVLPSDPLRSVHLTNTNRNTRIYLGRIIQQARQPPLNSSITDLQVVQLCRVSRRKFQQWFYHGVHLPKVFRRVRWVLREMIIMNILEDRGQLGANYEEDSNDYEKPIPRPNRRTMLQFKKLTKMIRAAKTSCECPMENPAEAEDWLKIMQGGWFSSSNSIASNRTSIGASPAEEHPAAAAPFDAIESAICTGKLNKIFCDLPMKISCRSSGHSN